MWLSVKECRDCLHCVVVCQRMQGLSTLCGCLSKNAGTVYIVWLSVKECRDFLHCVVVCQRMQGLSTLCGCLSKNAGTVYIVWLSVPDAECSSAVSDLEAIARVLDLDDAMMETVIESTISSEFSQASLPLSLQPLYQYLSSLSRYLSSLSTNISPASLPISLQPLMHNIHSLDV